MILSYSVDGKAARSVFFHHVNDIDIYVEDSEEASKKVHTIVLARLMDGRARVGEVFPLGGREIVVERCARDKTPDGRPRAYLIDGDINLLAGGMPRGLRRLVVLPLYCMENVLICEHAALEVLFEEDVARDMGQLAAAFDFQAWADRNHPLLAALFVEYALARHFLPQEATVKLGVGGLQGDDSGLLDPQRVEERVIGLRRKMLASVGRTKYERKRRLLLKKLEAMGRLSSLAIASGKDYLLPLLNQRMRHTARLNCTRGTLRVRLAKHCRLEKLASARTDISRLLTEHVACVPHD